MLQKTIDIRQPLNTQFADNSQPRGKTTMSEFEDIIFEKRDNVVILTINRPKILNAMRSKTRQELTSALKRVAEDNSIRTVILTGAGGRAFSAGEDVSESVSFDPEAAKKWVREWDMLYEAITDLPIPSIAMIDGYAVGAGLQIALLCDIRVASENSKFGYPEIDIGIPTITGTYITMQVIGWWQTVELVLTGEKVNAERAKRMGIVNHVVRKEELQKHTEEIADKLAEKPPISMAAMKQYFSYFRRDMGYAMKRGSEIHKMVNKTGEPAKYMKAFLEERKRRRQEKERNKVR